jgi:hypothetical protein
VVLIPLDGVDSQIVIFVGFSILVSEGSIAKMNVTFFSTNKEQVVVLFVEVEAHTTGKTIVESLLLGVKHLLVLIDHKLELEDLFSLELVLHQGPVSDTAIR